MELLVGKAYYLEGMAPDMWDAPHPVFGAPLCIAARYLGSLQGLRLWHGFEVWVASSEQGVLFMNDEDLNKLKVTPVDESFPV